MAAAPSPPLCGAFHLGGLLGTGASAVVLLATRASDGAVFALKRFKTVTPAGPAGATEAADLLAGANGEYNVLHALQHAHM